MLRHLIQTMILKDRLMLVRRGVVVTKTSNTGLLGMTPKIMCQSVPYRVVARVFFEGASFFLFFLIRPKTIEFLLIFSYKVLI